MFSFESIGYGIIYESCENAAKHLATNLSNESISVVKHKYGEDASVLTENAAFALGNSALAAYYVGGLGPKSVCAEIRKKKHFGFASIFRSLEKLSNKRLKKLLRMHLVELFLQQLNDNIFLISLK